MNLNFIAAIFLMVVTGYFDGLAFSKAPQIWTYAGLDRFYEILKTLLLFGIGLLSYIASTYFLHLQGIENALVVTLVWFAVTIVGISILSGSFLELSSLDKTMAVMVIILVGILYFRGIPE